MNSLGPLYREVRVHVASFPGFRNAVKMRCLKQVLLYKQTNKQTNKQVELTESCFSASVVEALPELTRDQKHVLYRLLI